MEKRHSNIYITFVILFTLLSVGLILLTTKRVKEGNPQPESFAAETLPEKTDTETKEDILSPDGKYTLSMVNLKKADGTITQTLFISTVKDPTKVQIFTTDATTDTTIMIPQNTFSPDDKYIFIKMGAKENPKYLVFRTDGKDIRNEEKSLEITSAFYEKYTDFKITEVTGWGGIGLIVINTDNLDGKIGPSFWFEVGNSSFIRLSTRFN